MLFFSAASIDNIMVAVVLFVLMTFCLYGYNFPLKVLAVLHVFLSLTHMDLAHLCLKLRLYFFSMVCLLFSSQVSEPGVGKMRTRG